MSAHAYWRINITAIQSPGPYFTEVCELQFREEAGTPQQATGGSPVFSSQYATSGNLSASAAFDGNATSTNWLTPGASGPAYIGYHFATSKDIKEVALTACNTGDPNSRSWYAPKNFTIDFSDDGSAWTTIATVTNQTNWVYTPTPDTRLFATVEAPANAVKVSQETGEVLYQSTPNARISQEVSETIYQISPALRTSQEIIEILYSTIFPPAVEDTGSLLLNYVKNNYY